MLFRSHFYNTFHIISMLNAVIHISQNTGTLVRLSFFINVCSHAVIFCVENIIFKMYIYINILNINYLYMSNKSPLFSVLYQFRV